MISPRASLNPSARTRTSLAARLRFVNVFSLSERQVAEEVSLLERDGLFRKLLGLEGEGWRVLRRKRYAHTRWAAGAFELDDARLRDPRPAETPPGLLQDPGLLELLQRVGAEKFERYFLYQETPLPAAEIAAACGLTADEAGRLVDLALELSVRSEFFHPSSLPAPSTAVSCLGEIYGDASGFGVMFYSPHLARGRYEVDYEAWRRLRADGRLPDGQVREAAVLINQIETLNMRSDNLQRLIREGVETQRAFLAGEGREKLRTLSLREAARRLHIASSTACRLVADRSVKLPWKEEVPLAALFPQKKEVLKEILEAHEAEIAGARDAAVQGLILDRYQLRVPRRTVNYWRHKLAGRERAP